MRAYRLLDHSKRQRYRALSEALSGCVAHNRVREAIDPEDRRKEFESVANPLASMFVGFPADRIIATEKRPPNTTTGRVTDLHLRRIDHLPARKTSHRQSPQFELPELAGFYQIA